MGETTPVVQLVTGRPSYYGVTHLRRRPTVLLGDGPTA